MAKVLRISITINQTNCLLRAAFHKATPFQGMVHKAIKIIAKEKAGDEKSKFIRAPFPFDFAQGEINFLYLF